jgi:hypothetical protein
LGGAVNEMYGVGYEIVEFEACRPACKREGGNIREAFGYPSHAHVVYELLLDRVGEGSLNIKKKSCCYFTSPPCALDFMYY